jgi:hypothetical protein
MIDAESRIFARDFSHDNLVWQDVGPVVTPPLFSLGHLIIFLDRRCRSGNG